MHANVEIFFSGQCWLGSLLGLASLAEHILDKIVKGGRVADGRARNALLLHHDVHAIINSGLGTGPLCSNLAEVPS